VVGKRQVHILYFSVRFGRNFKLVVPSLASFDKVLTEIAEEQISLVLQEPFKFWDFEMGCKTYGS
jgi:hypothetical protein